MSPGRRLVYDFMDLPYVFRVAVMSEIGVVEPGDESETVPDSERYRRWFRRAKERGLIDGLRSAVDSRMGKD